MMSETVKTETSVETLTEEERRRIEFNSRIGENYRRMMTMDGAALKNEVKTEERQYPSLDAYRPLHARKEITFEDVQIPEEIRRETEMYYSGDARNAAAPAPTRTYSPVQNFQDSIYAAPGYREAALRRERASAMQSAMAQTLTADETLSMPTATTLQYGNVDGQAAPMYATATAMPAAPAMPAAMPAAMPRVIASAAQDARAYYAALLKKAVVGFAVACVLLLVVIAVNSAILSGMNGEIASLQQTLDSIAAQAADLQAQIDSFIVPGENGVPPAIWEFITESGMIAA